MTRKHVVAVVLGGLLATLAMGSPTAAQEARFWRGDANADADFDLSDPLATLGHLFQDGIDLSCPDAADVNDDGGLDVSDATFSLNYLFLGGATPPAPGADCGVDPTQDGLECTSYSPCGPILPTSGQSEFETPILNSTPFQRDFLEDAGPPTPATPTADPGTDEGATAAREIEEADLYKIIGDRIFVLNRYRGLQIIDISDLDQPSIIGKAPIFGYPFEMYVRGTTAYVLVSDFFDFWVDEATGITRGGYGSQVRIVDIADEQNPEVVGSINLAGYLSDSRIVGDILYLVAQHYTWHYRSLESSVPPQDLTRVTSIQLGEPDEVQVIDVKDFPRDGWEHHLHVTPEAIYLAASGWDPETRDYRTRLQYVDISHPGGLVNVRGEASVPGRVQDRWSMDEHEGVLRIASGQSWGNGDIYLSTYSVEDPDRIGKLGRTTLAIDESLTAARFDADRGYLVSFRRVDPVYVFDLSDPTDPRVRGELKMSGWLDFLVPQGDRLIALGHDEVVGADGRRTFSLAVSLIDVANATQPTLLSRVGIGGGWGFVPGDRDDFAKVFRVVPDSALVMFPFQSWTEDYRLISGVQLIDYDDQALDVRGLIDNAGYVERGIPHEENTVLTVSDQVFQAVDISDRDEPSSRGRLELARNVQDFAILQDDYTLQFSGDWQLGDTKLSVTPIDDPNTGAPVSQLNVPAPNGRMFTHESMAYVVGVEENRDPEEEFTRTTRVRVVDFSDPTTPKERGTVALPQEVTPGYRGWYWGFGDEVEQVNGTTLAFHRFHHFHVFIDDCLACRTLAEDVVGVPETQTEQEITLVDLSDPNDPKLGATIQVPDRHWGWGLRSQGNILYLSTYRTESRLDTWVARYFLHRFDVSDPANPVELPPINIPGMFVDASPDGDVIYTLEDRWDRETGTSRTFFYALHLVETDDEEDSRAVLASRVELQGSSNGIEIHGHAAVATVSHYGPFPEAGVAVEEDERLAIPWRQRVSLVTIDLRDPTKLRIASDEEIPYNYAYLQKVSDNYAFLGTGPGVFVYDISDIETPAFKQFFRTQGWVQDIVLHREQAYLPSGWHGIQVLNLR